MFEDIPEGPGRELFAEWAGHPAAGCLVELNGMSLSQNSS